MLQWPQFYATVLHLQIQGDAPTTTTTIPQKAGVRQVRPPIATNY